jgi:hypothetical protein
MSFESEYKLDDVAATPVAADKIDATFRSSTIGQFYSFVTPLYVSEGGQIESLGCSCLDRESECRNRERHCASLCTG